MIHIITEQNSVFSRFLAELRDITIQQDRMRFRRNVERCGEIMAYEISKIMDYAPKQVQTPMGTANVMLPIAEPVLATVLRAGLPLHQGLLNYFDHGDNAFISAFRHHDTPDTFHIEVEYLASPSIEERILILADPMLATGQSMALAYEAMLRRGRPRQVHFVSLVASPQAVEYIQKAVPEAELWLGCVDAGLNDHAYIIPGLGDAGDLAFGLKE